MGIHIVNCKPIALSNQSINCVSPWAILMMPMGVKVSPRALFIFCLPQLVYISGCLKLMRNEYFLVMVVRPVSPPSILELRMEANMFITHYNMEMNCLFFDGR